MTKRGRINRAITGLGGVAEMIKPILKERNLDGLGEEDIREFEEDIKLAIEALKELKGKKVVEALEKQIKTESIVDEAGRRINLKDLIEYYEGKQKRYPNLTPISKKVTDTVIKELKGKQSLMSRINDEMLTKRCYRYGTLEPMDCDKCDECLTAEKLQWNEGMDE